MSPIAPRRPFFVRDGLSRPTKEHEANKHVKLDPVPLASVAEPVHQLRVALVRLATLGAFGTKCERVQGVRVLEECTTHQA